MSVITKDLGVATAYGYAKSKGYTGTEEEFAELMASYVDVAQQAEASAQDAEDAKDAAITAKTAAQTAQTAAESAQTAAAGSAQTASTKASEASNSAQTAAGSATAAGNSATAAAGSASTAQTAAQTATTKASEASSSASAANTAKTDAQTARTGAQTAQTAAETAQANAEAAASSVSASAAQIEQNTEEIGALKNDLTQGTFPVGNAENASQLTSTVGIEDTAPYLFRTSGGSNDIGDREDVRKIVGVSVPWNQQIPTASRRFVNNSTEETQTMNFLFRLNGPDYTIFYNRQSPADTFGDFAFIAKATATGNAQILHNGNRTQMVFANNISVTSGHVYCGKLNFTSSDMTTVGGVIAEDIQLTDLTLDYGTSIADYVLSLESATRGAGVAWLKKNFPAQFNAGYQAYDVGSLQSVSGLTAHKMVGFNQWDEVAELGAIGWSNGINVDSSTRLRSKNYIPCMPSTRYYVKIKPAVGLNIFFYDYNKNFISYKDASVSNNWFDTLENAWYIRFFISNDTYGTTYNHDICINFHWDGEKDGTYEPYKTWSYALDDSVVIRGIPKVDANGNLYYDGDEYLPDGTVTRNIKVYTLAESNISYASNNSGYVNIAYARIQKPNDAKAFNSASYFPLLIEGYPLSDATTNWDTTEKVGYAFYGADTACWWVGFPYGTTLEQMKTAMAGKTVLYAANPTTEIADPYQATQIVDDWGTEEYVLSDGAFPVPVGHVTMYQNNLRAKLEMSPESPDGDGLYVVQQESGENTYVPLASTATIQDILTRLTALENA